MKVKVAVRNIHKPELESEVDLPVDTGAIHTVLRRERLVELGGASTSKYPSCQAKPFFSASDGVPSMFISPRKNSYPNEDGFSIMMSSVSVRDVFSKDFATVNETDPLSRCLELFKKDTPPVIGVLNEKGKYAGIIARKWIVRARLDPATTKVKTLMRPAPKIEPDTSLGKAARLMIESGVRQAPVFEHGKLRGFITEDAIIHATVAQEWGNTPVEKIMTKAPYTVEAHRSVGAVLSLFKEHNISHMPVVDKGKLVGMVSTQDIIENVFQPQRRQTLGEIKGEKWQVLSIPAKGIMKSPVLTVKPETTLREAEKKMHDFNVHSLVVTSNERIIGIVTRLDFLETIAQETIVDRKLTIQFAVKDVDVNEGQQTFMMDEFDSFARKYKDALQLGTLFVYFKGHGPEPEGEKVDKLTHCRMQLRTVKGFFVSSAEGWGAEPTFRVALERLERKILRSKEMEFDPTYQREFLRRLGYYPPELR